MMLLRAGWHCATALRVPANTTLVPLPPYSPELNPVERVWLHLKQRCLSMRLLNDYRAVVTAASRPGDASAVRLDASPRSRHTRGS